MSTTKDLTFEPSEQRRCTNILIVDDAIVESRNETLAVVMSSTDKYVSLTSDSTLITIYDDDGK